MGEGEEYVGNTDTPDECENLVRKRAPTASGMKWGDPILMKENNYMEKHPGDYIDGFSALRRCYAEFGNEVQDAESWRVCLFQRKYFNWMLLSYLNSYRLKYKNLGMKKTPIVAYFSI